MSSRPECHVCGKQFRGDGGLDWHSQRIGHVQPDLAGSEPDSQKVTHGDLESVVFDTVDSLELRIVDLLAQYPYRWLAGGAANELYDLVERLRSLGDILEFTGRLNSNSEIRDMS